MNGDNDVVEMIRANRSHYPGGERVILASEAECRDILEKKHKAERAAWKARAELAMWQAATAFFAILSVTSFMIGISL